MSSTSENVGAFDTVVYEMLNSVAGKYFQEDPQLNWIPQATQGPVDAPKYKKPLYGASVGVTGAEKLGLPNITMKTPQNTIEYDLEYVIGDIWYDANDMLMEGPYLAQRKTQEVLEWGHQVKQSIFKGVFPGGFNSAGVGQGVRLNDGIIEQATLVQDLNGGDSLLDAAGDVYKALSKMVNTIPFRYRDGKTVVLGCDDLFASKARTALFRGATNQISELDLFLQELSQESFAQNGQKVAPKLIISNDLFLNLKVGTTKTELDVLGTNSRLFAGVIDSEIIEQAYSRVGLVGEDVYNSVKGVNQRWAARCSGCVHRPEAILYSERITWA